MDRRQFIKSSCRNGLLTILGLSTVAAIRKRTQLSNDCQLVDPCHSCGQFSGCHDEKAQITRANVRHRLEV